MQVFHLQSFTFANTCTVRQIS
ncbi:MAG: hypothetical protein JWQ28_3058, partial [Pedobacter sp.]|nr:hypothetical protein [Pedobacter sp.]